jgi:hypothetical protein
MNRQLKTSVCAFLTVFGFISLPSATALAIDLRPWEDSTNPATKERYIPVELWSGAEWDGKQELKMVKVDGNYRHRTAAYSIRGPKEWIHPATGQTHSVYERINPGKSGTKWQIFVINEDRTGLGRLYDGRPNRDTRTYSGGLKFPLGLWKEGETRKFAYRVYEGSTESTRVEAITIQQIDFAMGNDKHCLEFYWVASDKNERKIHDRHSYTYCPGKSMIVEIQY